MIDHKIDGYFPSVLFTNGKTEIITPFEFKSNIVSRKKRDKNVSYLEGCMHIRTQLPLKLAWAMTVHKSQG